MRRTPHSIKKDPKIWDMSTGTLKEGYTFHPVNEGYEQVSSIKTQKRTGAGKDGTNWEITGEKAIYKDGPSPNAAPAAAPMPDSVAEEVEDPNMLVQLSGRAAAANAGTAAYEQELLNTQGSAAILGNKGAEQSFKNQYQSNLTEELKAKDPTALAAAKAKYQVNDAQAANLQDDFSLNLGSGNMFG